MVYTIIYIWFMAIIQDNQLALPAKNRSILLQRSYTAAQ